MEVLVILFICIAILFVAAAVVCHIEDKPILATFMSFTAVSIISTVALAVL